MQQKIEFSVVIAMHNGGRWIEEQLDALAIQVTDVDWEVVVADNGSTDDGPARVNARIKHFPVPLRLIDASEKKGIAFARNRGAAASKGVSLGFCDCDDRVSSSWVDSAAHALRECDVVTGPRGILGRNEEKIDFPPKTTFGTLLLGNNYGLNRRAYNALGASGALDENLPPYGGEDIDLSIRISELKFNVMILPQMLVYFRVEPSRLNSLKKVYKSSIAEVAIWRKHESRFQNNLGLLLAIGNLIMAPVEMLKTRNFRRALRLLVRRYAHVIGQITIG